MFHIFMVTQVLPESILNDAVLAVSPTGTGMVALEDEWRLLRAELWQQTALLRTNTTGRGVMRQKQNMAVRHVTLIN